jgi:hypothetical protein
LLSKITISFFKNPTIFPPSPLSQTQLYKGARRDIIPSMEIPNFFKKRSQKLRSGHKSCYARLVTRRSIFFKKLIIFDKYPLTLLKKLGVGIDGSLKRI